MPSSTAKPAPTKRFPKKTPEVDLAKSAAELVDARIQELAGLQGALLSSLRRVITGAHASMEEQWKWNTPVWSSSGIICTGESYKKVVKLTFAKGASLPDPSRMFNSSLDGNVRRAIDFPEGSVVNEAALAELVRAAVRLNTKSGKGTSKGAA